MDKIKICIVEDELEFQEWIVDEINEVDDIESLGTYDLAEDALIEIPRLKPDIVIMDLGLNKSNMDGIECMLRLKLVSPGIKFLVITSNTNESLVFEALRVGAGAYIQKGDIPRDLIDLIREFYQGGAPMSPGIARRLIESFHKPPDDLVMLNNLSTREMEILDKLSQGFLYKEIADQLKIAEGTVKQHAHNIYQKLQVNNRTEAIRKYLNK
ncbi:MAG TPA: response regulator transcription factor [Saprospiraceae bacterium]|nr:response regulator transcription factor [Saprospiraceae bacterium]HMQ82876.1 response regulator transcription factor [Saprospiraceae bacterium]